MAAELFYTKLFELDPTLQLLFCDDLKARQRRFTMIVAATVRGLARVDVLLPAVRELGIRHPSISVVEEHHANVASALLWTLAKALRGDFTPAVKSAWIRAYGMLSQTMREATRPLADLAPRAA
ncbi:MAG TPA: globin domain-containing protein [Steroidobacteraceae bacterium]|nr:globin domain-containing protein [Steroidobacteraceae bacterium]